MVSEHTEIYLMQSKQVIHDARVRVGVFPAISSSVPKSRLEICDAGGILGLRESSIVGSSTF